MAPAFGRVLPSMGFVGAERLMAQPWGDAHRDACRAVFLATAAMLPAGDGGGLAAAAAGAGRGRRRQGAAAVAASKMGERRADAAYGALSTVVGMVGPCFWVLVFYWTSTSTVAALPRSTGGGGGGAVWAWMITAPVAQALISAVLRLSSAICLSTVDLSYSPTDPAAAAAAAEEEDDDSRRRTHATRMKSLLDPVYPPHNQSSIGSFLAALWLCG